jgi:hypothetical protein
MVLSTYVYICKLSMTRNGTRKQKVPFYPQIIVKILTVVLANNEIISGAQIIGNRST